MFVGAGVLRRLRLQAQLWRGPVQNTMGICVGVRPLGPCVGLNTPPVAAVAPRMSEPIPRCPQHWRRGGAPPGPTNLWKMPAGGLATR